MIKDTNPDHYKVDGANFIEYMNDPKIAGFGNWMFANGYNSGVWASTKWSNAMWREQSDKVLVTVAFKDGTKIVTTGETHDGVWNTTISRTLESVVTHWQAMPEPPKEDE